ncbi:hypothetical protein KGQ27_03475 [Patescibacteria group bacterium]|nr:hypothetical protein [Patescibacteria group bacterium]MDE1946913.1 hypothetical protein [Patescibacteria group bacterium]MDE2011114.1 hypothetical protein [Patescibacteria group bacterium]MDE2233194.1 hypothetical protein [Patescibacteria group bacterium]
MSTQKTLGRLKSGEEVVDREVSHIHAGAEEFIFEALARIESRKFPRFKETIDLGRVIGRSNRVSTGPGDEIVFAQRVNRPGLSRFVKNREPEPTTMITVKLHRLSDTQYELRTAYIGEAGVAEPWDEDAKSDSIPFWSAHALCWGYEPVVPGTETVDCPW